MEKKKAPAPKMPAQFYVLAAALTLGFACVIISLLGGGLLAPTVPLSQSPALLAICIVMLSFYSDKPREKVFHAAFLLFVFYFTFVLAIGEILAVLPLAASIALSLCAKNKFKSFSAAKTSAICAVAASASSAVFIAVRHTPLIFAQAQAQASDIGGAITAIITGRLTALGYTLFAAVPVIFFAAVLMHISKIEK